jgi:hypothetical protein
MKTWTQLRAWAKRHGLIVMRHGPHPALQGIPKLRMYAVLIFNHWTGEETVIRHWSDRPQSSDRILRAITQAAIEAAIKVTNGAKTNGAKR